MKPLDAQLSHAEPSGALSTRIAQRQHERMLQAFCNFREAGGGGSVLNVCCHGITPPGPGIEHVLGAGTDGSTVVSCSLELKTSALPRYGRNDGRQLLYGEGEFDWVYCEGLLEHAGSFERQFELLKELNRVAAKGVFATTANRRHPLDVASMLPLLHWLPGGAWQRLFARQAQGRRLLGVDELSRMASLLPGQPQGDIGHIRLMGPKSQFFLMLKKG